MGDGATAAAASAVEIGVTPRGWELREERARMAFEAQGNQHYQSELKI
jgi:hypothetical protein